MTLSAKRRVLVLFAAAFTICQIAFAEAATKTNDTTNNAAPTNTTPTQQAVRVDELFPDPVVARGKGFEIKRSQVEEALISIKANLPVSGRNMPPDELLERQVLDRLIQIRLLLNRATDADKAKGKEAFNKELQSIKTNLNATAGEFDSRFNRQLRAQGLTREQWEKQRIELATIGAVLERELAKDVSEDEIKKFYQENPSKFERPEMVRVSHILLRIHDPRTNEELSEEQKQAKRKQIEEILKRARAGEDFAKLAREYSEDPGGKDKGAEYTFRRGQMVPEFEAAAFSLKTNQVSDVITTRTGYYIIKSGGRIPPKIIDLAEVKEDIRQFLKNQQIQKQLPAFIQKLKEEAKVEILDERLKPKEVSQSSVDARTQTTKPDTKIETDASQKKK